MDGLYRFREYL